MQATLLPLSEGLPDFNTALSSLDQIPTVLYRGMEHAALKTASFRDTECPDECLDGGMSASLFRFYSLRHLKREGIEDIEQDNGKWTFDWLPFMGMSFHYNRRHVRILKGRDGCLPGCGASAVKRRFFGQIVKPYLIGTKTMIPTANLVVLWDFDVAYGLARLWLALPAVGGPRPQDVSAHWIQPIPHPTEMALHPTPQPPPSSDDLGGLIVPLEGDLDQKKKTGNEPR